MRTSDCDAVLVDAAGNIKFDSKAERIKATKDFAELAARHANDALSLSLLKSYNAAIDDPSNAFVHLYEIRDALKKKFGGEGNACSTLKISRTHCWGRLGQLADGEPLLEGRHRGARVGKLRHATPAELDEARGIAREMIRKYLEWLE